MPFDEDKLPETCEAEETEMQQRNKTYKYCLTPLAFLSGLSLLLTWTVSVVVAHMLRDNKEGTLGKTSTIPTVSDASRNRTEHPLHVLAMTATSSLLLLLAVSVRISQSGHIPSKGKRWAANIGFWSSIFSTITVCIGVSIFVDCVAHIIFIIPGVFLAWLWTFCVALVPPPGSKNYWTLLALRHCSAITLAAILLVAVGFLAGESNIVAIGEYIALTALPLNFIAIGVRTRGVELHIWASMPGEGKAEQNEEDEILPDIEK